MPKKRYVLTPTARAQLREAKSWSRARWGVALTQRYFEDLENAAQYVAAHHKEICQNPHSELGVYPVREHYIIYTPLDEDTIAIVAVIRQGRDIPSLLQRYASVFARELREMGYKG